MVDFFFFARLFHLKCIYAVDFDLLLPLLNFLVFESARSSDGRLASRSTSPSCTYSCGGAVRLGRRTFRRSSLAHDTSLHPFTHHRHGPPSIIHTSSPPFIHPPIFSVHPSTRLLPSFIHPLRLIIMILGAFRLRIHHPFKTPPCHALHNLSIGI